MRYLTVVVLFIFTLAAQADVCETTLKSNYSKAINELAQGYINLERMKAGGLATTAIYVSVEKNLEKKRALIIEKLGEKNFLRAFHESLKILSVEESTTQNTRHTRRQRSIETEHDDIVPFISKYRVPSRQVTLTNDGNRFLNTSHDMKISMRDFATGKELYTFRYPDNNAYEIKMSADEQLVALTDIKRKLFLWNAPTGDLIYNKDMQSTLSSVQFSPDSKMIAAKQEPDKIHLLKTSDASQLHIFETNKSSHSISSVNFNSDGTLLLGAINPNLTMHTENSKVIHIWDTKTFKELYDFRSNNGVISAVWQSGSNQILVYQFNQSFTIWNLATGEKKLFENYLYPSWSHDGRFFAANKLDGQSNKKLIIWKSSSPDIHFSEIDIDDVVWGIEFSPDFSKIAAICSSGVIIWDFRSGIVTDKINGDFYSFQWSRSGKELILVNRKAPYEASVHEKQAVVVKDE